jgi:AhpD family alkylhydroperoxidase
MSEATHTAGVANGAPGGVAGTAATAAGGGHHPIIGQRKPGSTVALLRRADDLWAIYVGHRLDPAFREEMMVAVAGADSCRQCSFAHREWALAEGLPEAELAALEGLDVESFDAHKWAAIAWAQAAVRSDFAEVPDAIESNFKREFSAQEQADIELATRTMFWLNETSNGVDAALSRLKGTPVPGSGVLSESAALVLYAVFVPVLLVMLSVKQRRSPIALVRGMVPFFREFEARGR